MERRTLTVRLLMLQLLLGLLAMGAVAAAGEPTGKDLFLSQECNACHSVKSAGIAVLEGDSAAPVEGEEASADDAPPPDLSEVGPKHDAAFLHLFLTKQEKLNGKKHMKRFKGEKAELDTLVNWLLTLKPPKPDK